MVQLHLDNPRTSKDVRVIDSNLKKWSESNFWLGDGRIFYWPTAAEAFVRGVVEGRGRGFVWWAREGVKGAAIIDVVGLRDYVSAATAPCVCDPLRRPTGADDSTPPPTPTLIPRTNALRTKPPIPCGSLIASKRGWMYWTLGLLYLDPGYFLHLSESNPPHLRSLSLSSIIVPISQLLRGIRS